MRKPERLRPFISFYGGKYRTARYYPEPLFNHVVEPFAGSAGYAVNYYDRKVTLYEVDPIIYGVWKYLIETPSREIAKLPLSFDSTAELDVPQAAKWLIGFWISAASSISNINPSTWSLSQVSPQSYWGESIRKRIASQVEFIRHWKVINKSYDTSTEDVATWFVDPPYHRSGVHYRFNKVDYQKLSLWCQSRLGQVIVCEQHGADWLPFQPFRHFQRSPNNYHCDGREVVYHRVDDFCPQWANPV